MCRVNSDESVPDASEHVQLKLSLYAQHKAVLLQLRIKGRLVKPVLIECMHILIFESVNPKLHRDGILCVQACGFLFHCAAYPANISRHDEFVPAAGGRRVVDSTYLGAGQIGKSDGRQKKDLVNVRFLCDPPSALA